MSERALFIFIYLIIVKVTNYPKSFKSAHVQVFRKSN